MPIAEKDMVFELSEDKRGNKANQSEYHIK